ncbi:MAG TPA: hypothetical protein VH413_14135 [Verrucomicrobiae bacterium]|jgi:hypothetical protein|nr:hypothetical protein [Verrucomicrobiae bacterium]
MSSITEIEEAIQQLSPVDQARLRDWLVKRPIPSGSSKAKNGAELAALWPACFHLTVEEAEGLAQDLEIDRKTQSAPKPAAWE